MSDPNLIRLCKLPSDLGPVAGRELFLDADRLTFFVGANGGVVGANGATGSPAPEALADLLATHPTLRDLARAFIVGRMTGHPKAFEEEKAEKLQELLAKVTDENRHEEVNWGPPVGRETW